MTTPPPSEAVVVIDRFTSASSSQDAVESLQVMVDGLKRVGRKDSAEKGLLWETAWILDHDDATEHLVWLLQHGTLKGSEIPCEEGVNLACQLYQHLATNPESMQRPTPGLLLESLLDLLDNSDHPIYVRVSALKVLEELSKRHKSVAGSQWQRAPNGLHRLADLLAIDVEVNPMEEAIRNQALVVAKLLAREASVAKVFLFAEVECKLLDLCWNQGGLTKGGPIVIDSLELIQELLRHADTPLQDLVWQHPNVARRLAQLLDLRGGEEFLHPKKVKKSTKGPGTGGDDDLETLLTSGVTKKEQPVVAERKEEVPVPRLLQSEEEVVNLVLNILRLLLETESLQSVIWTQYVGLCSLVWELALINPSIPPLCALPSPTLQQRALDLVADKFNDPVTMTRHSGLDRLLYLVCTGGGTADQFDEKLGLSQSALAVLRQTLTGESIHDILIRTLAPPPMEDDDSPPPGPTVVHKLWNTVQENLMLTTSETRTLFLSGALGGLGLMLCDEESKEIMFKVAAISMDQFLESALNEKEELVQCSLLRFLCEWIYQCPFIARSLLCSHQSMHLAGMATKASSNQALVHLLVGVSMESLTKDEECGGWSRSGILQIITKVGISKYTSSLESLKTRANPKMPWVVSDMEFKSWKRFCSQAVLGVRKCVVEALASESGNDDGDGESEEPLSQSEHALELRPLQKMISQQAREMDELRRELEISQGKVVSQERQLVKWKRRVESTPTELDDMLNELTTKTSELEESVQSLKSELKRMSAAKEAEAEKFQAALSESQQAVEILETQKQAARDELDRAEQEMQALSQAYASLEEDYQRNQNLLGSAVGAGAGEASQQQGEGSRQQHSTGSTEVATLRAENARLRNDARAADEWMAMAVQRMNEMGSANIELEQQIVTMNSEILILKDQLNEAHVTTQSHSLQQHEEAQSRLGVLESELGAEKSMRAKAEREVFELQKATLDLKNEHEKSALLENRLLEADDELSRLRSSLDDLRMERERTSEIERRLADAEEKLTITSENLRLEKGAKHELENHIEAMKLEVGQLQRNLEQSTMQTTDSEGSQQVRPLQGDSGNSMASADAEIPLHPVLLKSTQEFERKETEIVTNIYPDRARELEEVRQKSEQEIYRLESVIRELEDRLGSGLGEYKIEDIRTRDSEIDELRKSNEAAQEWMTKAVEHHQLLSAQVTKLLNEKRSLSIQLDELQAKLSQGDIDQENAEDARKVLLEKTEDLNSVRRELTMVKSELGELKRQKDENQGFLDELGIALDDVGVMQQKLLESQSTVRDLEMKIAGNALNAENDELKASNLDLEKKAVEFQAWVEMAETKIAELMSSQDEYRRLHQETMQKLENEQNETKTLNLRLDDALKANAALIEDTNTLALLKIDVARLEQANESLRNGNNRKSEEFAELMSRFVSLQGSADLVQKQLDQVAAAYESLENNWNEEKELVRVQRFKNDELKAENINLLTRLEDFQTEGSSAQSVQVTETLLHDDEADDGGEGMESLHGNNDEGTRIFELVEELRLKEKALVEANQSLSEYDDVLKQWEDRVSQLQSELQLAHQELVEQEKEANNAINIWQDSCSRSEEKCSELEEKLKASIERLREMSDDLNTLRSKATVLGEENAAFRARESPSSDPQESNDVSVGESQENAKAVAELREALQISREALSRSEEIVHQWEERATELETNLKSLETQVNEEKDRTSEIVTNWQETCAAAEEKCKILQQELERVIEVKDALEASVKGIADQPSPETFLLMLQEKEEALQSKLQEIERIQTSEAVLRDHVAQLEDDIKSNGDLFRRKEDSWNLELSSLTGKCSILEQHKKNESDLADELEQMKIQLDENIIARQQYEDQASALQRHVDSLESQLEEQEAEATRAIQVWEEQVNEAEEDNKLLSIELENVRASTAELIELRDALSQGGERYTQMKERADELSVIAGSLEQQLRDKEQETKMKLAHAQTTCVALEAKCTGLENEIASSRDTVTRQEWSIEQLKLTNEHCFVQIEELKSNSDVKFSLEAAISSSKDEISLLTMVLESERQRRIDEQEQLQAELANERGRHAEAREEIETLSSTISSLKAEISRLTVVLESERRTRIDERENLQAELADERGRHAEARDEIETLSSELDQVKNESDDVVRRWTARYQELDDSLKVVQQQLLDVQQQLVEQEREANDAISIWELKSEELENGLDLAESELSRLKDILVVSNNEEFTSLGEALELVMNENESLRSRALEMQSAIESKRARVEDLVVTIAKYETRVDELAQKASSLEERCQRYAESDEKLKMEITLLNAKTLRMSSYEEELDAIKLERDRMERDLAAMSRGKLQEERDRLELVIAKLEGELRDATDLVQAYCTNGSTDKATQVAALALREEIDELKNKLHESWEMVEQERAARDIAELEIGRLRDDIAALVSVSDKEDNPSDLKKLTSKAIEKLQKRERSEIDGMRKSLFRALEELEVTRSAERESNEKLSKVRLQICVYEQEIMAAKSEINFLTQAMEELRETEENKKASLEYRIGMLGNENDVVRKYHAAELENVRSELAQTTMEKDRILHQLKESEKTNASLLFAASKGDAKTLLGVSDIESECAQLRIENAHLLTMAADDKARAERRVREILAVQSATIEADVILEHELRVSAEAALETLRLELDELRSETAMVREHFQDEGVGTRSQPEWHEFETLKDSFETLRRENASLKNSMRDAAKEAKTKISMLNDECYTLHSKLHKMDRDERYEVAVQSEIARMKLSSLPSPRGRYAFEAEWGHSAKPPSNEKSRSTEEAFDFIRKQKEEIEEERKRHREDIAQYEDLLALVAQQDLEKKSLKEALIEAAGAEAAREAVKIAEEMAAINFGTVVRVN